MVSAAGGVAACESHEASDNVAYTVASQNERRSALLVTSVFCLFALAIAPFGHRQLPEITTFLPAVVSCGFVAMALTASLLFAQFQAGGFTPLATLGLAYAASAALLLPYLLTFPRIFSPTGLLGAGAQSSTWLHVSWHLLFCALVALYVVFEKNGASAVTFRVTAYSTACVVFGTVLVATFGHAFLPALVQGNRSTWLFHAIVSPAVAVAVVLATVLLVATTRLRARCHLWLAVVLVALLVETLMINFESGARYSCGWYCARAVFLSASVIFLVMLQMQYMSILRRVNVSKARLEQRNVQVESLIERELINKAQLAESKARYQGLTDAMPQLVWILDDASSYKYVNARWSEYTGLTLEQSAACVSEILIDTQFAQILKERRGQASLEDFECEGRLRRSDGSYRWHLVRAVPFHGVAALIGEWIVTATDIEARKAGEAGLAKLHDAAIAATESKSRFLATMSHEIRTPMNGVIGMTELLLLTPLSAEQRDYMMAVHDSGRSLLRLLNDILDYSKVEAGKLDLEHIEFNLSNELECVVRLMGSQFESKDVSLATHIDPSIHCALMGDPGRLRQILINLVGNALKFTASGGTVRIVVTGGMPSGDLLSVRFAVEDTGIGIDRDAVDRLFQPFAQGDGSITRRYGGTGLGLTTCAQLVALMKGTIGVESVPHTGSSFWFLLPFQRVTRAELPREAARLDAVNAPSRIETTARILLVEDNDINTRLAVAQFKRLGLTVSVATNGKQAVEAVQREHFDLVFMDCHMPEMDGFAATKEIRRLEAGTLRRVPIVAMTADARQGDQECCLSFGMDDYLSKPTSLATLRPVLDRWLPIA